MLAIPDLPIDIVRRCGGGDGEPGAMGSFAPVKYVSVVRRGGIYEAGFTISLKQNWVFHVVTQ